MKIRIAQIKDAEEIAKLNEKYFHEKGRDFEKYIKDNSYEMIVAEDRGQITGFTGLKFQDWNQSAEVIDIFVHPNFRKQGIGTRLVKELVKLAKVAKIRVLIAEAPSKNPVFFLYKKCGFRKCGYNDRYYDNQGKQKAIFMSFDLE